jgi:hypothetical protein
VDSNCYTLLVLEQPRVSRVDVFDPSTEGPRSMLAMGAALPFHERAIPHRFPSVRLFRTPSESLELLLRVESDMSVQLPFVLHTEASLYANAYTEQAGMGIFYGVVLALLLYNLSMLIGVRDRTYLAAVAYLAALGLFTLGCVLTLVAPNLETFVAARILQGFGIAATNLSKEQKAILKITGGVLVEDTTGAAARAGIQSGDVIVAVNNQEVNSVEELTKLLNDPARKSVALLVKRGESAHYVSLRLEK